MTLIAVFLGPTIDKFVKAPIWDTLYQESVRGTFSIIVSCLSCVTLRDSRHYWLAWYSKSSALFSIPC